MTGTNMKYAKKTNRPAITSVLTSENKIGVLNRYNSGSRVENRVNFAFISYLSHLSHLINPSMRRERLLTSIPQVQSQ